MCQNYRERRATNGGRPDLGRAPAPWKFRSFSRWCQIVSVNPRPGGVLKIPVSVVRFRPCPPAMIGTSWHGSRIPLRGASCLSPTCSRSGSGLRPSKPCGLQPVMFSGLPQPELSQSLNRPYLQTRSPHYSTGSPSATEPSAQLEFPNGPIVFL